MKKIIFAVVLLLGFQVYADVNESPSFDFEMETDASVLTPEEEQYYFTSEYNKLLKAVFPQTKWKECSDTVTGNYLGYKCSNNRGISQILKSAMARHFLNCANEGLRKTNGKKAVDLHVVHKGIQGDANHSPRSLHAEARAVDVGALVVTYSGGTNEQFTFTKSAHQTFFNGFRECWGRTVNRSYGCPFYSGSSKLTGSIGKEDRNHQQHLHISVPHCVGGRYSSSYFQK